MFSAERFWESRMREILTSGSTRGEEVGLLPRLLSYSTLLCMRSGNSRNSSVHAKLLLLSCLSFLTVADMKANVGATREEAEDHLAQMHTASFEGSSAEFRPSETPRLFVLSY
jgi:hypothetical protein